MEGRSERVFPGTWEDSKMIKPYPHLGGQVADRVRKSLWALGNRQQREKAGVARAWSFKVCGWDV